MQVETCNCFNLMFKSVLNIILLSAHKAKKKYTFPASDWPYPKSPTLKYLFYQENKKLKIQYARVPRICAADLSLLCHRPIRWCVSADGY